LQLFKVQRNRSHIIIIDSCLDNDRVGDSYSPMEMNEWYICLVEDSMQPKWSRPLISETEKTLRLLIEGCWNKDPGIRPRFEAISASLMQMTRLQRAQREFAATPRKASSKKESNDVKKSVKKQVSRIGCYSSEQSFIQIVDAIKSGGIEE
jgi:hypothetical protein